MVERKTATGRCSGPDECLTVTEALARTRPAGPAAHAEPAGDSRPRRLADLVVLDDDPTTVDPDRIGDIGWWPR